MKIGANPRGMIGRVGLLSALCCCLLVADRGFALVFDQGTRKSNARLPRAYTGRIDGDVWIIGNSRAIKSFDLPQIERRLQVRVENLGVNGIRPALQEAFVIDSLQLNPAPRLVIIEISYLKSEWDDSLAAEFLPYAEYGDSTRSLLNDRLPKQMMAADIFNLRRFGGQLFL